MKLPKSVVTPLTYQLKLVLNLLHQTTKIQSPTYDKKSLQVIYIFLHWQIKTPH